MLTNRALLWQLTAVFSSAAVTLGTVVLAPSQRGTYSAVVAAAAIAATLAACSLETLLPVGLRPNSSFRLWVLPPAAATGTAAVIALCTSIPVFPSAAGAAFLTASAVAAGDLVARRQIELAQRNRGVVYLALACATVVMVLQQATSVSNWLLVWVAAQGAVLAAHLRSRTRGAIAPTTGRLTPAAMISVHAGVVASVLLLRVDQLLIAAAGELSALGAYALAVAATETATSPSLLAAHRLLAARPVGSRDLSSARRWALPRVILLLLAALVSLGLLGMLKPAYGDALHYALMLAPGAVAVALARLHTSILAARGDRWRSSTPPLLAALVGVPMYVLVIPHAGATGAAVVSTGTYCLLLATSLLMLRQAQIPSSTSSERGWSHAEAIR